MPTATEEAESITTINNLTVWRLVRFYILFVLYFLISSTTTLDILILYRQVRSFAYGMRNRSVEVIQEQLLYRSGTNQRILMILDVSAI